MTAIGMVHRPRRHEDLSLGTRQLVALLTNRHPDQVRRLCRPVACDVRTHLPLYDLATAEATFAALTRRARPDGGGDLLEQARRALGRPRLDTLDFLIHPERD